GSLMFLDGGGSWQTAARLEAANLSAIEVSELVGTETYTKPASRAPHSLLRALAQTVKLPFANLQNILSSQLPAALAPATQPSETQSSLLSSLYTWQNATKKIALGWIPYATPSETVQMIKDNPGITVISPKWLSLSSNTGSVSSSVQSSVVSYAHAHGVKVWALFDNQFDASLTHKVLQNVHTRLSLVNAVVQVAKTNHLDGLNVDFENVQSADQTAFTSFIQELHQQLQPLHITLSVDITPDIVFLHDNAAFFHAGLASVCDYIIVMAYDEHWGGDQTPGPVADVPWVTSAVYDLLDTGVPSDKLILGLPFYARFWHIHSDGSVTSQAVADGAVAGILQAHHATSSWNSALGVAYARYPKSDGYEEVWYETTDTLARKLALVNDEQLAGTAVWSLSLSDKQTWSTMIQALRQTLS
ncbi:MAG: hypothetical protein A2201_00990, partial [Alicyclobacillus sp. RIFOXYA1_FULL_53_8]